MKIDTYLYKDNEMIQRHKNIECVCDEENKKLVYEEEDIKITFEYSDGLKYIRDTNEYIVEINKEHIKMKMKDMEGHLFLRLKNYKEEVIDNKYIISYQVEDEMIVNRIEIIMKGKS